MVARKRDGRRAPLGAMLAALLLLCGLLAPREAAAAARTYRVRYDANGGAGAMAAQTVAYGRTARLRANTLKRSGHVFKGWNTKRGGKGRAYADRAPVKNLARAGKTATLYAQWRAARPYTVRFDANGGTGEMAAQSITYNRATALPAAGVRRAGYEFAGWNTRADGSGRGYADRASVTNLAAEGKTATLYAQWELNSYTVTYDANGGSGAMAAQTVTAGRAFRLARNAYTRDGCEFAGWNAAADGSGEAYDDREIVLEDLAGVGGGVTMFAQWRELPRPDRPATYTVAYDANGGTGAMGDTTVTLGRYFKLARNAFSRDGWEFAGWNAEAGGTGEAYDDREVMLEDLAGAGEVVTLYAQWRELPGPAAPAPRAYAVEYDANGGGGTMPPTAATVGRPFRLARCAFTRDGWEFVGWSTSADGSGDSFADRSAVVEDLAAEGGTATLYAQWREPSGSAAPAPRSYVVEYDANGGAGTTAPTTVERGTPYKLSKAAFSRENWEFAGWNTEADGSGDDFGDREVMLGELDGLAAADGTVTLYARWRAVTWTVEFDLNGGDGEKAPIVGRVDYPVGSTYLSDSGLEREGHVFCGWSFSPDEVVLGQGALTIDNYFEVLWGLYDTDWESYEGHLSGLELGETYTLHAIWADAAVIHFDANGCRGVDSRTVVVPRNMPMHSGFVDHSEDEDLSDRWSLDPEGRNRAPRVYVIDYYDEVRHMNVGHNMTFDEAFPDADGEVTLYCQRGY